MTHKTALVALHYQNEVLHPDGRIRMGVTEASNSRDHVVAAACRLLGGARRAALPIVHVRIAFPVGHEGVATNAPIFRNVVATGAMEEGSWGAEWYPGLGPLAGEDVVTHRRVNAFYDSPLDSLLRDRGATRLIMAGVATNSVVEHSARHAADMGYEVVVATDACSAADPQVHDAALFNISLIGQLAVVDDLFEEQAA